MNEISHSLNAAGMRETRIGLAVFGEISRARKQRVHRRNPRTTSLTALMAEIHRAHRRENQVWGLMALAAAALVAMSLWI